MKAFELFAEIQEELKLVEDELSKTVEAPDELLTATSAHLLHAGGKRLRPAFALLAAKITGDNIEQVLFHIKTGNYLLNLTFAHLNTDLCQNPGNPGVIVPGYKH